MEVMVEDQASMGMEAESNQAAENTTFDQEDEFDFTIGGDDDLGLNTDNVHESLEDATDENDLRDDTAFNYEPGEQDGPVNDVVPREADDQYTGDEENQILQSTYDAAEAIEAVEIADNTNEGDDGNETEQMGSSSRAEPAVQDHTEEHTEYPIREDVDYEVTNDELEAFENNARSQIDHDIDHTEQSTSVDKVSSGEEIDNRDSEVAVDNDQDEDDNIQTNEVPASDDTAEYALEADEPAGRETDGDQIQYVGGKFGGGKFGAGGPSHDGDDEDQLSPQKDLVADLNNEVQDQDSWDEEDHDDEGSGTRPKITVMYQSQEYSLFAESSDQDPDFFFLADLEALHQPLSQLLASIRDIISDEIAPSQEVFLRVNGLGFEFAESTMKDFIDETTFAQIVEVNKRLTANEGGSPSPILHCYLGLRPSCSRRFSELSKAAEEGKGFSDIAMFYDDVSVDESTEEIEEHNFSQDMISESVSLDDAAMDDEGTTGRNDESNDTKQYYNPFQTTETQFSSTIDVNDSNTGEAAFIEQERLSAEGDAVESTEFEDANVFENATGDIDNGFDTTPAEVLNYARGQSAQQEDEYNETMAEEDEAAEVEHQTEFQTDLPKDDGNNDDTVATYTDDQEDNDDDYLDLGNDEGDDSVNGQIVDSGIALDQEAILLAPTGNSPRTSHHSSATATLDGDHNGLENDNDASNGEVDEIDWNHDDEGDLDHINQNPATLSPSSPSAKRFREEEENAGGTGDENAIKRRRT